MAALQHILERLRGSTIERDLGPYAPLFDRISTHGAPLTLETDNQLRDRATALAQRARGSTPLDDLLPEFYALVREVAHRTVGLRPFDVQILAGIALHQGKLAEMQTGEGKTLAAAAYGCDITYATAVEAGFDFLRDQLVTAPAATVHRGHHFALVDEADSILIDEARIPLVIAGAVEAPDDQAEEMADLVRALERGRDYDADEYQRNVHPTDEGLSRVEEALGAGGLHESQNLHLLTQLNLALHTHALMHRNVDYLVRDDRVEIIDEFTGRVVDDRHWPDGLQAAVEAKERVRRRADGAVLGSITIQHFLGQYEGLCGMTATACAAAEELDEFYGLGVVVIPPNQPCVRRDEPDVVFTHRAAKHAVLVQEIARLHAARRPVLVGTASVAESDELGGLCVVGTNRHESRRIDDQLRGRAGRQGDAGSSRFYISLEDPLIQPYRIDELIPARYRTPMRDAPIDHPVVRREIDRAQRIVEGQNLEIRRTLWGYSQFVEKQRRLIQERRGEVLRGEAVDLRDWEPELHAARCREVGETVVDEAERRIALHHLDSAWRAHLAEIADLRDGIHLVGLGGLNPLDEFHKAAGDSFDRAVAGLDTAAAATFRAVALGPGGLDLDREGLRGPSSTWTYLVNDDAIADHLANMLMGTRNMGLNAAAGLLWPLLALWIAVRKWAARRR